MLTFIQKTKIKMITRATPYRGKLIFFNQEDFYKFCCENEGIDMIITIKPQVKTSEKLKIYAYLYGPLLETVIRGFTRHGYSGIDKVSAMYKMKAEFAKDWLLNDKTSKAEPYLLETSEMTKERLLKFVTDIIFFCETELEMEAPDAQEYKMMKLTGHKFKIVKNKK